MSEKSVCVYDLDKVILIAFGEGPYKSHIIILGFKNFAAEKGGHWLVRHGS